MIRIDKEKILHYILIFLTLQYIGGRLLVNIGSVYYGIVLAISLFFLFTNYSRFKLVEYYNWVVIITASLLVTFLITFGGLSFRTLLAILSRFLIVWVVVKWNTEKLIERFLKVAIFLSVSSLISYFIITALPTVAKALMPYMMKYTDGSNGKVVSYGLFFFAFNVMDKTRNSGIFGEPGEMQIMINLALYFSLFRANNISQKKRAIYVIVLLITMITNSSTTGLVNTAVLVICYLLGRFNIQNRKIRTILILSIVGVCTYFVTTPMDDNFIYTRLINKVTVNGALDLSRSTGSARLLSFTVLEKVVTSSPLSIIWGVGYRGLSGYITEETVLACAGLISGLIMYGVIANLLIYGKIVQLILQLRQSWLEVVFLIFYIANNGLSQPDILAIVPILVAGYFMCIKENVVLNSSNKELMNDSITK